MARFKEADHLRSVPLSGIRRIFEAARALEQSGVDVVHLELGRPDFDTPAHVKEAAVASLARGEVHYTSNYGIPELCAAVCRMLEDSRGVAYDPRGEIIVTLGAGEAIYLVLAAYLSSGDEVLVPDPGWLNYAQVATMMGARAVPIPLDEDGGYELTPEAVSRAITPLTRGLILNSPHNPTGSLVKEETLRAIAELTVRHDLWVLSDEIYEHLIYDGARHVSIASLPGMRERTFIVHGVSKTYSMTGWRIGFLAGPRSMLTGPLKVHQYLATCATSFAQAGAVAALTGPQDCVETMRMEFARRRHALLSALLEIPGLHCVRPAGAFYVFPNLSAFGLSAEQLAEYLLREGHVAVVPGTAFGPSGEGHVRVSYCDAPERVVDGAERIARALSRLPRPAERSLR